MNEHDETIFICTTDRIYYTNFHVKHYAYTSYVDKNIKIRFCIDFLLNILIFYKIEIPSLIKL